MAQMNRRDWFKRVGAATVVLAIDPAEVLMPPLSTIDIPRARLQADGSYVLTNPQLVQGVIEKIIDEGAQQVAGFSHDFQGENFGFKMSDGSSL